MKDTKKGHTIPQTVENLQAIMALDGMTMQALQEEIDQLRVKVNSLQQKLKSKKEELENLHQQQPKDHASWVSDRPIMRPMTCSLRYVRPWVLDE